LNQLALFQPSPVTPPASGTASAPRRKPRQQGPIEIWATSEQRDDYRAEVERALNIGRISGDAYRSRLAWIDAPGRTVLDVAFETIMVRVYNNRHEKAQQKAA
jgi:hypothetical protein